ncbi:MAG: LacI family DNA-binding transcriptional regulator [Actinomycetota bacterium]|nr:LacI family DNA-binding transcriptional regulator [Actinomycetota bacterium]
MAQVASDAGVSIPTVSRVINRSAPVADATRQTVLRSIERLGYHPNPMARGLSRGRSDTVLVILPHITEPSVTLRLSGLIGVLRSSPYELHVVDLERPVAQGLRPIGEIVMQNRPAGVVIISLPSDDEDHQRFRDAGVPIVLVDSPSSELPSDFIDDVAGGEMATRHLITLGHIRIGFIGDREDIAIGVPASANRRRGYERALEGAHLSARPEYVRTAPHGTKTAEKLARQMLALPEPPTAIFAASDVQAFGALAAARNAGVRVPQELSIIGFDDVQAASLMGLTTVRQPLEVSGCRAGIRLLELLGHPTDDELPDFPQLELVVRDTTAPLAFTAPKSLLGVSTEASSLVTEVSSALTSASGRGQQVPRRI